MISNVDLKIADQLGCIQCSICQAPRGGVWGGGVPLLPLPTEGRAGKGLCPLRRKMFDLFISK